MIRIRPSWLILSRVELVAASSRSPMSIGKTSVVRLERTRNAIPMINVYFCGPMNRNRR